METISPAGEQPPPAQSDVVVRSAARAPQFCASPGFGAIFRSWALSTNNNTRTNLRRVSMWLILLLRLAVSILLVLYAPFPTWLKLALRVFLGLGLTVGFFAQVWYIAMMDRAEGYRMLWRLKLVCYWHIITPPPQALSTFSALPHKVSQIHSPQAT